MEVDDDDGASGSPSLGNFSLVDANIGNDAQSMEGNDDGALDTPLLDECVDRVNQAWSPGAGEWGWDSRGQSPDSAGAGCKNAGTRSELGGGRVTKPATCSTSL